MAAKLHRERVPSVQKYHENLALEELKSYDERLKLINNIVSKFLYSDLMKLRPEIEFPAFAKYLHTLIISDKVLNYNNLLI